MRCDQSGVKWSTLRDIRASVINAVGGFAHSHNGILREIIFWIGSNTHQPEGTKDGLNHGSIANKREWV